MTFDLSTRRLYGILDLGYVTPSDTTSVVTAMLEGGVQFLQLRAKGVPKSDIPAIARPLASICRDHAVPFVLNDHPDLVEECEADGAHVGQDDMSVAEARALAGEGKIIGLSTHSPTQARAAVEQSPDYIGFGPLFATQTWHPPLFLAPQEPVQSRSRSLRRCQSLGVPLMAQPATFFLCLDLGFRV
jgi:thiamine-phosphate pyrophosphorylase